MPKTVKEPVIVVEEQIPEVINISKKTGKVKRVLTEKQLENLKAGRIKAIEARKQISEHLNLKGKVEVLKEAKENDKIEKTKIKEIKNKKKEVFKENNEQTKLEYDEVKTEIFKKKSKPTKKIKTTVEYLDGESSDDEDKPDKPVKPLKPVTNDPNNDILKMKLNQDRMNEMAAFLKPTRF